MRVVCLSDTHDRLDRIEVPDGDLLVHAGDLTMRGELDQLRAFDAQLAALPHPHKVVIAGNHDFAFERDPEAARACITAATYLEDEEVEVAGLRIYGSPWQPWFHDWAFNLQRGAALAEKWARIPEGLDILLTHGPPAGYGDRCYDGRRVGCADLLVAIERARPRFHIFGHIHEDAGRWQHGPTTLVNACNCTLRYKPTQPPVVLDIPDR